MIATPFEIHEIILPFLAGSRKVIGLTSGAFDLTHFYHLLYLERCKALCDFLIVGVDSNRLIETQKKKTPLCPTHQRLAMVEALKPVDVVFTMNSIERDFLPLTLHAGMIFKNSSKIYGKQLVGERSKQVLIPDVEESNSTSDIVARIQKAKR